MQRSIKGSPTSLSGLSCMMTKLLSLRDSVSGTPSSNLSTSLLSTIESFTTCTSNSCLSLLNQTMFHCPLCHIPAITDFSSLISRTPTPVLPPISQQQWLTGMTSSFNSPMGSRPSITPCNNISLCRQEEGPLILRKLSRRLNFMMGHHKSFMNGGWRQRFGLPPPMPPPPIERRQRQYSRIWKGLMQAIMHRFASMSAWRPTLGPHGQISKWRSRISSSRGTTRSGQGPNSCVFDRAPARG